MVSRARNFASFAKSMEDKTFVSSPISGTTTKTGTINIPLDTEDFTDYQIGQSSTAGKMVDPTTGNVTLTIPQANEANKKFTLHFQIGYDTSSVSNRQTYKQDHTANGRIYSSNKRYVAPSPVRGLAFNGDGTRVYWLDYTADQLSYMDLDVPYDIHTGIFPDVIYDGTTYNAHYNGAALPYSANSGSFTVPRDVTFNDDGTRLYVVGSAQDAIQAYEFTGGVAYGDTADIFEMTSSNDATGYMRKYLGNDESNPTSVTFNSNGTKMYIAGTTGNTVDQYTLSTAWDVATATRDGQLSGTSFGDIYDCLLLDSGNTFLFLSNQVGAVGNGVNIFVFDISATPDDITTVASLTGRTEYSIQVPYANYSQQYWLEPIDKDSFMSGGVYSECSIVTRGNDYTMTLPASVKDSLPTLSRHFRYQVDLSSNNANSGSAEWYITDIRSVRV